MSTQSPDPTPGKSRRERVYRTTPAERRLQARLAAQTRWARTTPAERRAATQAARDAFTAQLNSAPNPAAARAAHMTAMSLKASRNKRS